MAYATLMTKVKLYITPAHLKTLASHYTDLLDRPIEFTGTNDLVSFLSTDRGLWKNDIAPLADALSLCEDMHDKAFVLVREYSMAHGDAAHTTGIRTNPPLQTDGLAWAHDHVYMAKKDEPIGPNTAIMQREARANTLVWSHEHISSDTPLGPHTVCMPRETRHPFAPAPFFDTPVDRDIFQSIVTSNARPYGIPPSVDVPPRKHLVVPPQDWSARLAAMPEREDQDETFPWSNRQPKADVPTNRPEPTDAEYAKLMAGLVPHFAVQQRDNLSAYYGALLAAPQYWPTATAFFEFLGERGLTKTYVAPLTEALDHCKAWPAARKLLVAYADKHGLVLNY